MSRILYLTLVKEYYRQNAIFIFAVMMFAFGFLRAQEHLTIIHHALTNLSILLLFSLAWILHGAKVVGFVIRALSLRQNEFLYHLLAFSPYRRFLSFLVTVFGLIQLTFFYSFAMLVIAFQHQHWRAAGIIGLVNVLITFCGAVFIELKIRKPNSLQNARKKYLNLHFRTPRVLFYPRYLLTRQTVLLLTTKSFTALVIMGVCYLYPTDAYDIRLISLGCLLAAFSQSVILQHLHFFERMYFDIYRNMPVSSLRWFRDYLLTLGIILLPEAVVLARNFPAGLAVTDALMQLFFLLSVTVMLLHYQVFVARNNESGFQTVFFSGMTMAILVMFKIPVWVFSWAGLAAAYLVLKRQFYKVE